MTFWWIIVLLFALIFGGIFIYLKFQFYPNPTMNIPIQSEKIKIFALKEGNVNCWVIQSKSNIIFIDTGHGRKLPQELKTLSISPEKVSHVFLTHSDFDHIGGLKYFDNAQIYVSKPEEGLIKGEVKRFLHIVTNKPITRNYTTFQDEAIFEVGDIRVQCILTPGHTLGHTAFLINNKYLFTGDTLRLKKNRILPFFWLINMHSRKQAESITKLVEILQQKKVEFIFTAHTGYSSNIESFIQSWM